MSAPLVYRFGALLFGALYFPLGLVWAYGLALFFLPLALLGFWLLRRADRWEERAGVGPTRGQARLRAFALAVLFTGLAASAAALIVTR